MPSNGETTLLTATLCASVTLTARGTPAIAKDDHHRPPPPRGKSPTPYGLLAACGPCRATIEPEAGLPPALRPNAALARRLWQAARMTNVLRVCTDMRGVAVRCRPAAFSPAAFNPAPSPDPPSARTRPRTQRTPPHCPLPARWLSAAGQRESVGWVGAHRSCRNTQRRSRPAGSRS